MVENFSVLMSTHIRISKENLIESISSLVEQTLKPSEIIIVKDGPLNFSLDEVCKLIDFKSFKIIHLKENKGLAYALNEGLKNCSFELIARMDSDDISYPNRFEKQIAFMTHNVNLAVSSGVVEEFDENMKEKIFDKKVPTNSKKIISYAKRRNPINHPAAIFRKSIIKSLGGYPLLERGQDYGLWSLLLKRNFEIGNLNVPLVKMRTGREFYKRRGISFFKSEYELLKFQKKIGFLTPFNFYINLFLRFTTRIANKDLKHFIYKLIRKIDRKY